MLDSQTSTGTSPSASEQAASEPSIPDKPGDILLSAAQVNGLGSPTVKPWHIAVEYDVFDADGDNVSDGKYEEFWVGPKQYRVIYTSKGFTQADTATDHGLYRIGNQAWPGELETRVRDEFVRPMFRETNLDYGKPEKTTRDFGQTKLPCVELRRTESGSFKIISPYGSPLFCFEPNSPILRYARGGTSPITVGNETLYQKIVRFQNQYVATEVQVMRFGKKFLEMRVQNLESISDVRPADFAPPDGATPVSGKITIDSKVLLLDYLVHMENPKYPTNPGERGTATVTFSVEKNGRVGNVQVVDGPAEMRKALESALPKYVYRPFVVMGEPVEVETTESFQYETH